MLNPLVRETTRRLPILPMFRVLQAGIWVLAVLAALLEAGVWTHTETIRGPFPVDPSNGALAAVPIGGNIPFSLILAPRSDVEGKEKASDLRLQVNGQSWGPPHTPLATLSREHQHAYIHWTRVLYFALPANMANDDKVVLDIQYSLHFRQTLFDLIVDLVLSLLAAYAAMVAAYVAMIAWRRGAKSFMIRAAHIFPDVIKWVSWSVIAMCCGYAATIGYGIYEGHALPSATVFSLAGSSRFLSKVEAYLPWMILAFAASGTGFAWLATFTIVPRTMVIQNDIRMIRLWRWFGLPGIACLLLFSISAGGWSGNIASPMNYLSLAGLVPHSDARAYFTDSYSMAYWGAWDILGSRRPLGQAFRDLIVFIAGYSYVATLCVQAGIVAIVLFMAAHSIVRWRGIWSGIAFVGFIYVLARPFLTTTLTEAPGLIWALISLMFLVEALRLRSLPHALVGFAGICIALGIRMGSMFSLPILTLWIALAFADRLGLRIRLFAIASAVVVSVTALNGLLSWSYGAPGVSSGGNFAWTACGLSVGRDWLSCGGIYNAELVQLPNENAQNVFLFAAAWHNIVQDPRVILKALGIHIVDFLREWPRFMFVGYSPPNRLPSAIAIPVVLGLIACFLYVTRARRTSAENMFWPLLFISVVLSAAAVLQDDGWRVLIVTHVFFAALLAFGFTAPAVVFARTRRPAWSWRGGTLFIASMIVISAVGPFLTHIVAMRELSAHTLTYDADANEHIVPGGRRITGFLVVADDAPLSTSIPSMHAAQFTELIRLTRLEGEFGPFVQEAIATAPFAFIVGGRLDGKIQSNIYVAPPAVLQQPDVWAWRFKLRVWRPDEKPWTTLRQVVAVEPLP